MSTGVPSLADGLTDFAAKLDGLCADQNQDKLSDGLRDAFNQHVLYNLYVLYVLDTKRVKALLDACDKVLQANKYDVTVFKQFRQLCGRAGLLSTSYTIPENSIEQMTKQPVASGTFSDIWRGIYNDKPVAVKALRGFKEDDARKVSSGDVTAWKRISHPNIVSFLEVSETPAPFCVVSEWMPNGNVRDYVLKNPETSRLQLLLDISRGLSFLHSLEIVHGCLKGDNILVDESGCARLNDFWSTSITSLSCVRTPASGFKGSQRWMAPELFNITNGEFGLPTDESDIFALGMVTFEVFTGQVPFQENKSLAIVMKRIINGEKPQRPLEGGRLGLSDEFWEVIQSSLAREVKKRPSASTFVGSLEKAIPDIAVLKELTKFDANSEGHIRKLCHILQLEDNTLSGMRVEETLTLIEVFDQVLDSALSDSVLRNQCVSWLQKLSARRGFLPKSYGISHSSLAEPRDASSATDKASSTRRLLMDGKSVAVKTISADRIEDPDAFKCRLYTNAILWKQLRHPSVVSFLGFSSSSPPMSLVYSWVPGGSLSSYVREHPDVDKLRLLLDVARGLTCLHRHNLVHGSLTGRNILVDSDGVACISEYGLETILRDEASSKPITADVRWMAPEVLNTKDRCIPSGNDGKAADVYSFAMVMFDALTSTTPFPNETDKQVVDRVLKGLRPEWPPNGPPKWLRGQIGACWDQDPNERPTAFEVLEALLASGVAQYQEHVTSAENHLMQKEQEHVDDYPDEMLSIPREPFSDPSGNTRSSTSIPTSPRHSGSDTPNQSGPERRTGGARGRIHDNLKSKIEGVTETIGPATVKLAARAKPKIIAKREEEVTVRDGCVSYVVSRPIPKGKKLRKVVITVVSKDQGWSDYLEDYGTYRNSRTWFELSVRSPSGDSREKWRGEVVKNLHAHGDFKEHTIKMSDVELYEKAESGDVLTVWVHAGSPGWVNTVKKVVIRYAVQ